MKVLLATALVSALLCAPALADPPPPAPATANVNFRFLIKDATGVRQLGLVLNARSCGSISSKSSTTDDEVKACSSFEGADAVRIELDWRTASGANEVRNKSVLVMRRGQTQQLDGGGAKLDVTAVWPTT